MEAATLTARSRIGHSAAGSPLLRLQPDERLVTMTRRGDQAAFEALVSRYQSKLLGFCRHMLGNREDAEDVLQEVFAAAYTAMLADDRAIMVKPWLYRIARNRSLNHMRRQKAVGVDSMDIHVSEYGLSTADRAQNRDDFMSLMQDITVLPETQRTALLLREIDGLPYEQIADVMETTVPSVKSLLVRARVALAEMTEARGLTCNEVRIELGEIAEGITRRMSPPVKRHVKSCDRCKEFKAQLTATDAALAAMAPVGLLVAAKNVVVSHLGLGSSSGAAGGSTAAAGSAAGSSVGTSLAGTLSAGATAVASKAAASIAAAAIVTAGAVQVEHDVVHVGGLTASAPAAIASATPVDLKVASRPSAMVATSPSPAASPAAATPVVAAPATATGTAAVEVPAAVEPTPAPAEPTAVTPAPAVTDGATVTISDGADISQATDSSSATDSAIAPEAPAETPAAASDPAPAQGQQAPANTAPATQP